MLKRNTQNSNSQPAIFGGNSGNTPLILPKNIKKSAKTTATKRLQSSAKNSNLPSAFYNHSDYLRITFQGLNESQFKQVLTLIDDKHITLEPNKDWSCGSEANRYKNKITSPTGLEGGYNINPSNSYQNQLSLYDVMIDLRGTYFANLTPIEQYRLLCSLNQIPSCKFTRFDCAIDDYSYQQIPVNEMIKAHQQGNYFGYQKHTYTATDDGSGSDKTTHYFGSRKSPKYVRVYDHKGKCKRMEAEFKGSHAQEAVAKIISLQQGESSELEFSKVIQQTLGGMTVGIIDFRDKSKLKNQSKAARSKTSRLPFYQEFIDGVGANISIKPEKQDSRFEPLEKMLDWLFKSVSKPLAKAYLACGEDSIWRLIEHGKSRLTESDYQEIKYWKSKRYD
jgi:hypothetical protein